MKLNKIKEKVTLNPIMTLLILIAITIVASGLLSLIGLNATYNQVDPTTGEYHQILIKVQSLFSLSGLKYIFSSTVENFASFTPLSMLIIILIGIGIMEKSGFLKTAFVLLTKYAQKKTVTFAIVLISILMSICGDIGYVIMIPISALLFHHGRRNPLLGIVASFAALTCGTGLSIFITSIDSSLLTSTLLSASVLDKNYRLGQFSFIFIMLVAVIALSILITLITEHIAVEKVAKYDFKEEKREFKLGRKEIRGLFFSFTAAAIYLLIFIYNIIPGLPFSGNLLDYSQTLYIDKLFSYNSFFSQGFIFIITMLFVILGFFYGIGARTIKNNNDLCEDLSHSLDGIGKTVILIFLTSVLLNVFEKSNIGNVFCGLLTGLLTETKFTGIPLIILFFIISAVCTILLPNPLSKWLIISGSIVPLFMNAGFTPEMTQTIFRFAEGATYGLTPLMMYYVIYLAYIEKYNQSDKPISLFTTIKYQLPYSIASGLVLLIILILWFILGIPLGIGGVAAL